MASPQKENGYTPIANEIMESLALLNIPLSHYEWKILIFIIRKTYGWRKNEDKISLKDFIDGTNILKPHVCRSLKKLREKNIITQSGNDINKKNVSYSYQKNYKKWLKPLPKQVTLPNQVTNVTQSGNESLPNQVTRTIYTKENKEKKEMWTIPNFQEVKTYCLERKNNVNPQRFIDFYEAKGWMIGKNKMKNWKAAVRTWEQKEIYIEKPFIQQPKQSFPDHKSTDKYLESLRNGCHGT